jgi:RHS repeat-associated protein
VTQWTYDTWNRLTSMIYPDSEVITYNYNLGGLLNSMSGNRQGQDYTYVQQLRYDQFESRVFLSYGNGTQTTYTYEPDRRRLQNLTATTGKGRRIMDNSYGYDKVSNILSLTNNAPVPTSNLMGGSSQYSYTYDDLYRLTTASGTYKGPKEQDRYSMTMEYNTVGSLLRKTQTNDKTSGPGNHWIQQKKTSYDLSYTYSTSQPHAATHIGRQTYTYDADGNQTGWTDDQTGQRRSMVWDEENRLRSVSVNGQLNSYVYDASGERVLKGQGSGQSVFVNGNVNSSSGGLGNFTVYVNPYVVVKSGEYSNHYFIEHERIITRLEHGWQEQVSAPDAGDTVPYGKKEKQIIEGMNRDQNLVQGGGQQQAASAAGKDARGVDNGNGQANGNGQSNENGKPPPDGNADNSNNNGNHYAYGHNKKGEQGSSDTIIGNFLYFYHPDHLGSTSYVTDATGEVYQHLEYFAFGETFVEEHSNTDRVPYLYNGKELDEETGLYYYGARYYDPRTSIWQSVDPLADKMPAWSPYVYNFDNPVKLVDRDGMKPNNWYDIDGKIQWRDHTGPLEENGKTYQDLGKNVLVGYHNRDKDLNEPINSAKYELYLETKTDGPTATIKGTTVPADVKKYGTLKEGVYPAAYGHRSKHPDEKAIIINGGKDVPTANGKPHHPGNKPKDKQTLDGVFFHRGNLGQASLFQRKKDAAPISEGCQTGPSGDGSLKKFNEFMSHVPVTFKGTYYLRPAKK